MDTMFLLMGVLMLLLGSAFFITSFVLAVRKKLKLKRFVETVGVVTNVEKSLGMRHQDYTTPRNALYKPTVRFQTTDGAVHDFTPSTSNSWSNFKPGERIPVFYESQLREKPIIGSPFKRWFGLAIFGFVGFFFACVGAFFTLFSFAF